MPNFNIKDIEVWVAWYSGDTLGEYVQIPRIEDFKGVTMVTQFYENIYIGDTAVSRTPTVNDLQPWSVTIGFDPNNSVHGALISNRGVVGRTKHKYADLKTFEFDTFIDNIKESGGGDKDQSKLEISFQCSGDVTVS